MLSKNYKMLQDIDMLSGVKHIKIQINLYLPLIDNMTMACPALFCRIDMTLIAHQTLVLHPLDFVDTTLL